MRYALGAIPSPFDPNDYPVTNFNPTAKPVLAPVWDFCGLLQPVRNQGAEGACVTHALTCVMGHQQNTRAPEGQEPDREILSVRDAYEGARMLEPVPGGAEGAYPRAALKYAQRQGIAAEQYWPYVPHVRGTPKPGVEVSRYNNRILTYSRVQGGITALKEAMYWHGPALIVVSVDEGFSRPGLDGRIISAGAVLGQHAIAAAGWDDNRGALKIRNSWGEGWGARGDAWLPYDWSITEAWVCTPALDAPPPEIPWWERVAPWWRF